MASGALLALVTAAMPALAVPLPQMVDANPLVQTVAADCNSAARRVVGQTGGQLLSVQAVNQGGRTVCEITVLVPGSGNERPRRVTVSVPQ